MERSRTTRWIATGGGPLLVLPRAKLPAWRGSYVEGEDGDFVVETPQGKFAFRTDYDFEHPRTDYERACGCTELACSFAVDGSPALVIGVEPLDTTWLPLADGGIFAVKHTVEPGADVEAELATLPTARVEWKDEGFLVPGGAYVLMDALDLGLAPETEPLAVELPAACRVSTANVETGRVYWLCIRLAVDGPVS